MEPYTLEVAVAVTLSTHTHTPTPTPTHTHTHSHSRSHSRSHSHSHSHRYHTVQALMTRARDLIEQHPPLSSSISAVVARGALARLVALQLAVRLLPRVHHLEVGGLAQPLVRVQELCESRDAVHSRRPCPRASRWARCVAGPVLEWFIAPVRCQLYAHTYEYSLSPVSSLNV